jgi:WD40 repeat protein
MPFEFRCACGHRWRLDPPAPLSEHTAAAAICLACGAVGELVLILEGPRAGKLAGEAITVPFQPHTGIHTVPTVAPGAVSETTPSAEMPTIPGYELLGVLGRGGMGVVYKARQLSLNRLVALKMILGGAHAGTSELARFLAEAEAAAQLQHAHIVQVHEIGTVGSLPFVSLEYVHGGNLAQRLNGTPLQPREAAILIETLAHAVHFAHRHGIVHRDLKPGNILLAMSDIDDDASSDYGYRVSNCVPKITDFGLAKRLGGPSSLTATGAMLGTPSYVAPEQAAGKKDIGPAVDIYALGAILYECLTGRPPFQGPTQVDTVLQVLADEPVPPRRLQPGIARDLETICLKCLQKAPGRRYASAEALASDLAAFLGDRPIQARPVGRGERLWRWCRRNPVVSSLLGVVAGCILVAGLLLNQERTETLKNLHRAEEAEKGIREQLNLTEAAEREKTEKLWQSYLDQARAGRFSRQMGQRFDSLDALARAARIRPDPQLRDEVIACLALPDLRPGKPRNIWPDGTAQLVLDGTCRRYARADDKGTISVRDLADDREVRRISTNSGAATGLLFSPDGRCVAATFRQAPNLVRVWDVDSGQVVVREEAAGTGIDFAADSSTVAIGRGNQTIAVSDLHTGKELHVVRPDRAWQTFALHPNGRQIAVGYQGGGANAEVYDLAAGKLIASYAAPEVWSLAWHANGRRLALGCADSRIYVWDVAAQRLVATMEGHAQHVVSLATHPSDELLASGSWDNTVRLWNPWSGHLLLTRTGYHFLQRFNHDPNTFGYIQQGNEVQLMKIAAGLEYRTLVSSLGAGQGEYRGLDISPDGRLLAVGMDDGVRLWDLATSREVAHLLQGSSPTVLFNPDGDELVTCGAGMVRRWPIRAEKQAGEVLHVGPPRQVPLGAPAQTGTRSADGRTLAVASEAFGVAVLVDLEKGTQRGESFVHPSLNGAILSPDGRWMVTAGWHSTEIKVWNTATRQLVKKLPPAGGTGNTFSPDGKTFVNSRGDEICFYDVPSWELVRHLRRPQNTYAGPVAFTADSRIAALELSPGVIHLVEVASGRTLARLEDPNHDRANILRFSPDSTRLVSMASYSRVLHVWDLRAIREHLAAMGLDWDQLPFPPVPERPKTEPLMVRVDPGNTQEAVAPVVAWTPAVKRRAATPQEIARWVRQLGSEEGRARQEAEEALLAVGPPALAALTAAARSGADGACKRAAEVSDRIAIQDAVAPLRIGLKLKDASMADAIAALSRQAGIPLRFTPPRPALGTPEKKVTLELADIPFWEALDRLCQAAGLSHSVHPGGSGLTLHFFDGPPARSGEISYPGPLRMQVDGITYYHRLGLPDTRRNSTEASTMQVSLMTEPGARILLVGVPRVSEATDTAGQALEGWQKVPGFYNLIAWQPVQQAIPFQAPRKRGGQLQHLKGVLPVDVMVRRRNLVTATELSANRAFPGEDGLRLTVQDVQEQFNQLTITLVITGPRDWRKAPQRQDFELVDAQGRRHRPLHSYLTPQPRTVVCPDDLAWLGAAPGAGLVGSLPWPALAGTVRDQWTGVVAFSMSGKPEQQGQLIFYSFEVLRTELPFEFHDLPLP